MPHLGGSDLVLLAAAGVAAGAINAAAGGGSLVSFPLLVAVGYPPLTANVTNTVALCPGYLGAVVGYRAELRGQRRRIAILGAVSIVGAVAGAVALATTSQAAFKAIVPWLVLLSCVLLGAQPLLRRRLRGDGGGRRQIAAAAAAQLPAAAYGAYFGAGLGVLTLAALGVFLDDRLQRLNALKGLLSLAVNWVAAAYFIAFEPVRWPAVLVVAPAGLVGGGVGAVLARRLEERTLRLAVVALGAVAAAYLFTR